MDASLCDHNAAQVMVRTIEAERGGENIFNERHGVTEGEGGAVGEEDDTKLNKRQSLPNYAESGSCRCDREAPTASRPINGESTARLCRPCKATGALE